MVSGILRIIGIGLAVAWCGLDYVGMSVRLEAAQPQALTLANQAYEARLREDGSVEVLARGGAPQTFRPDFTVLYRPDDPKVGRRQVDMWYRVPDWRVVGEPEPGQKPSRTANYFQAARFVRLTAQGGTVQDGRIVWELPEQTSWSLCAELTLPPGEAEPQMTLVLKAKETGWYSVGFTGAPEYPLGKVDALLQPRIWQEKRFPDDCYLSDEGLCSLPVTLVESQGLTVGVAADPAEVPFRLPTLNNSRFGVLVRNAAGLAQPQIFAPVLGMAESKREAGCTYRFRLRLSVRTGGWYESFRQLARGLYGVRDLRQNTLCSLNQTIENMVRFAMDDRMSGWNAEYRAFDYTTDVPGTVKLVSALHPLSVALVTDNEEVFVRRARPMIEYLLSREKYLFAFNTKSTHQNPSHRMDGPTGEVFEWATLWNVSQGRTPVFLESAKIRFAQPRALNLDSVNTDDRWVHALALYRATGERSYLEQARAEADRYIAKRIDTPQTNFKGLVRSAQFWTDLAPRWMQLLEMYEETGERRYLEASAVGARLFSAFCWMTPPVPAGEVTVPAGGGKQATVPAWRVSQIGLTPEASNTSSGNRAIFLAHHAAWMARLAYYTGDSFFSDLARNAVVGRYANYPGYTYQPSLGFTVAHEPADYPTREPFVYRRASQMYFNHVWPHIALLVDYLVSDALVRSQGEVDFPSRYAQGYVYLQSKVYGDRPGKFYGDEGVRLYLPAGLIECDNVQMNYVAGYGNGRLYVALMNQANAPAEVTLRFDSKRAGLDPQRVYEARRWCENKPQGTVRIEGARVTVPVAGRGITALAIDGAEVRPAFQEKVFDRSSPPLGPASYRSVDWSEGKVHGMLLSLGRGLGSAYVWLNADEKQLSETRLHYRVDEGPWQEMVDPRYPYEFSVALADSDCVWEYWVEGQTVDGRRVRSETVKLQRR